MTVETQAIEQEPRIENPVMTVIEQEFDHPELWDVDRESLGSLATYSGLRYASTEWGSDTSRFVREDGSKEWFAPVYGARVVEDPDHPDDNGAKIEYTDLETMQAIHERLSQTVLAGEHVHTSRLVTPPEPEAGIGSFKNNNTWVATIADGGWPVMAKHDPETGEVSYELHDYGDYHTGNMMLFPREGQDLISVAAQHELAWREKYAAGEVESKVLVLSGERSDEDPFASGFRGGSEGHTSGIDKIDNLSDMEGYFELLQYATQGNSGAEQIQQLQEYITSGRQDNPELNELRGVVTTLRLLVGDLVNFNTRHETHSSTTPEAVEAALQGFLQGTGRIADKLTGRYDGPYDDPPRPQAVPYKETHELDSQHANDSVTAVDEELLAEQPAVPATAEEMPARRLGMGRRVAALLRRTR